MHKVGPLLAIADDFEAKLLRLEEQFNRDLEDARKKDLLDKHETRESHLDVRMRMVSEMRRLSDVKAQVLMDLFQAREENLIREFERREFEMRQDFMANPIIQEVVTEVPVPEVREVPVEVEVEVEVIRERPPVQIPVEIPVYIRERPLDRQPYLGIEVQQVDNGVRLLAVEGPSEEAGLQVGDVLKEAALVIPITHPRDVEQLMDKLEIRETVEITFERDNKLFRTHLSPEGMPTEQHTTPARTAMMAPNSGYTTPIATQYRYDHSGRKLLTGAAPDFASARNTSEATTTTTTTAHEDERSSTHTHPASTASTGLSSALYSTPSAAAAAIIGNSRYATSTPPVSSRQKIEVVGNKVDGSATDRVKRKYHYKLDGTVVQVDDDVAVTPDGQVILDDSQQQVIRIQPGNKAQQSTTTSQRQQSGVNNQTGTTRTNNPPKPNPNISEF